MASEPLIVGYAGLDPDQPKRPGLVTAFGVASIVIGTFGVMFGLLCGGQTLLMHALPTAFAFGGGQPNVSRVNARHTERRHQPRPFWLIGVEPGVADDEWFRRHAPTVAGS
ncbi:MAG: hypothetical protein AAGI46_10565, partial [Planctomycetota bacterium]